MPSASTQMRLHHLISLQQINHKRYVFIDSIETSIDFNSIAFYSYIFQDSNAPFQFSQGAPLNNLFA